MNFLISFLNSSRISINRIVREIIQNYSRECPELCYAINNYDSKVNAIEKSESSLSILDRIIDNGFLLAVPKARRSLERRMTRRMGFGKMILPRTNFVVCNVCGCSHLVHTVCGNCYEKVKAETDLMQEAIAKELKIDPIDKEVVVVYEDDPKDEKLFEGKRIVEMSKERPQWFSKNLLIKDSQIPRRMPKSIGTANMQPTLTNDDK